MEITLLRHGKALMPNLNKISAASFSHWVEAYNAADLCPTSIPSSSTLNHAKQSHAVICSQLPRSIQSAKALDIKNITLIDTQFNEAGIPNANWRSLKLSPMIWAIIFRLLWLFGYSKNSESFTEAKQRASTSARTLISMAKEHKNVLLIGHGIYNKLLAKELRKLGWSGPANPGSKNWQYSIYKKGNHNE